MQNRENGEAGNAGKETVHVKLAADLLSMRVCAEWGRWNVSDCLLRNSTREACKYKGV